MLKAGGPGEPSMDQRRHSVWGPRMDEASKEPVEEMDESRAFIFSAERAPEQPLRDTDQPGPEEP